MSDEEKCLQRMWSIVESLDVDIRHALLVREIMETANESIPERHKSENHPGASTFNGIQNALALTLSIDLARIFDYKANVQRYPLDEQDKCSIPVLNAHLEKSTVQEYLVERARRQGNEAISGDVLAKGCRDSIDSFRRRFQELNSREDPLVRIRKFRNNDVAHALIGMRGSVAPSFDDIITLTDAAKNLIAPAMLALYSIDMSQSYEDIIHNERKEAEYFYQKLFSCL